MNKSLLMAALAALSVSSTLYAQTPASGVAAAVPATVTALCKDGTTYSGTTMKGACRGHKGVNKTGGAAPIADAASTQASNPSPVGAPTPASATTPTSGSAAKVWANASTKVYHCPGDKYYGKTKTGEYMSEADAAAKGYHADHGKPCH